MCTSQKSDFRGLGLAKPQPERVFQFKGWLVRSAYYAKVLALENAVVLVLTRLERGRTREKK